MMMTIKLWKFLNTGGKRRKEEEKVGQEEKRDEE